jgi:lysophospholipase L1-like esterase
MIWTFVALGDSLTEGVGDPRPDGTLRGWASRLAEILGSDRDVRFVNLARRSLLTAQVREHQLEPALALHPDLASVVAGMNDILRPRFDLEAYEGEMDAMVGALSAGGATVLTSTFPDFSWRLLPKPARVTMRSRLEAAGHAVLRVAEHHGAICLDAWTAPEIRDRGVLSVDRLHPGPRGHHLIALRAAAALDERLGLGLDIPGTEPPPPAAGQLAQARWLAANTLPCVVRGAIRTVRPRRP